MEPAVCEAVRGLERLHLQVEALTFIEAHAACTAGPRIELDPAAEPLLDLVRLRYDPPDDIDGSFNQDLLFDLRGNHLPG